MRQFSPIFAVEAERLRTSWASVCDHFARSFRILAKSVVLYSTCCPISETQTVVVVNGDECGKCCTTFCGGAICLAACCCCINGCRCGC